MLTGRIPIQTMSRYLQTTVQSVVSTSYYSTKLLNVLRGSIPVCVPFQISIIPLFSSELKIKKKLFNFETLRQICILSLPTHDIPGIIIIYCYSNF